MNKHWINKENNKACVLFFNGWGMDENAVRHLNTTAYDVCMFNKYHTLDFSGSSFKEYDEVHLVSWSLGVWVAAKVLNNTGLKFSSALAINGTLLPIDSENGLPPMVFDATLKFWDDENREKFNMRSLGGKRVYDDNLDIMPVRDSNEQKQELEAMKLLIEQSPEPKNPYKKALIGTKDLIFAARNQLNFWTKRAELIKIEMGHFPFAAFKSWNEIINL